MSAKLMMVFDLLEMATNNKTQKKERHGYAGTGKGSGKLT